MNFIAIRKLNFTRIVENEYINQEMQFSFVMTSVIKTDWVYVWPNW